jgi:hypothetical protein
MKSYVQPTLLGAGTYFVSHAGAHVLIGPEDRLRWAVELGRPQQANKMKTMILTAMLAVTAVSGIVAASQSAFAGAGSFDSPCPRGVRCGGK